MSVRPIPTQTAAAPTRLHPDDVEAIAVRVAALLREPAAPAPVRLVDAATLARILGVDRDWVYSHARELHAVRLGGERGRLRFDLALVFRCLSEDEPVSIAPVPHGSAASTLSMGGELLPIDP